jgi:hypothetical protein
MGKEGPKNVAAYVILMLFLIRKRLSTFLSCIKDGSEGVSDTSVQQDAQV